MDDGKPRVFFFSTLYTPFIEEDYRILSSAFRVERLIARAFRAVFGIPGGVRRSSVAIAWFGSVYAGILVWCAARLRRKSVVVVAGIDASKDREINYGIWLSPWKVPFVRYAFRHADRVAAVDPFLAKEVKRLAGYPGKNIVSIPFGFDGDCWRPGGKRDESVLTIAACHDAWRMKKKGIDKLFEAAAVLPEIKFLVIGIHERLLPPARRDAPANVELVSYIPRESLLPYLQRAKVYCQPSYTEGLPNALCEAMLCGCIPVGTTVGGIPTAIGDAGFLVPYGDRAALVDALRKALAAPKAASDAARNRILSHFTLRARSESMRQMIQELTR